MRFKIGDRVVDDSSVYANLHGTIKGTIEEMYEELNLACYVVKCEDNTLRWYGEDTLDIDKEWYREERLKELGL